MAAPIAPAPTWLLNFDPTNPSASLKALLPAKGVTDPANGTAPAGFNILAPKPAGAPAAPTQLQRALDAFTVTANTFLIQSAINGYQPLAAPAVFGSTQSYYAGVNSSAQTILAAGKAGTYGNINALA